MDTSVVKENAGAYMATMNCAESVFKGVVESISKEDADKMTNMASGFGGGMGCKSICGAVTGGCMALGYVFGRNDGDDKTAADKSKAFAAALQQKVIEKYGSTMCEDLTRAYADPVEKRKNCTKIVSFCAGEVADMIVQN